MTLQLPTYQALQQEISTLEEQIKQLKDVSKLLYGVAATEVEERILSQTSPFNFFDICDVKDDGYLIRQSLDKCGYSKFKVKDSNEKPRTVWWKSSSTPEQVQTLYRG